MEKNSHYLRYKSIMMEVTFLVASKKMPKGKGYEVSYSTTISAGIQKSTITLLNGGDAGAIYKALDIGDGCLAKNRKKLIGEKLKEMFDEDKKRIRGTRHCQLVDGAWTLPILDNRGAESPTDILDEDDDLSDRLGRIQLDFPLLREYETVPACPINDLQPNHWVVYKEKELACIKNCTPKRYKIIVGGKGGKGHSAKEEDLRVFMKDNARKVFTTDNFSEDDVYNSLLNKGTEVFLVNLKRFEVVSHIDCSGKVIMEGKNTPHHRRYMVPENLALLPTDMYKCYYCEEKAGKPIECAKCYYPSCSKCCEQCLGFRNESCDLWVCQSCRIYETKRCSDCDKKAEAAKERRRQRKEDSDYEAHCNDWDNDPDIAAGEGRDLEYE